jgi:hypothetical protein
MTPVVNKPTGSTGTAPAAETGTPTAKTAPNNRRQAGTARRFKKTDAQKLVDGLWYLPSFHRQAFQETDAQKLVDGTRNQPTPPDTAGKARKNGLPYFRPREGNTPVKGF